jgi:hypothetical protein
MLENLEKGNRGNKRHPSCNEQYHAQAESTDQNQAYTEAVESQLTSTRMNTHREKLGRRSALNHFSSVILFIV